MATQHSVERDSENPLVDRYLGAVDIRIDLARMEFYRQFARATSNTDFYIESLLNIFIAVAQTPLNFAVFHKGKFAFHLANDIKYHDEISEYFENYSFDKDTSQFYNLFHDILGGEYQILIMHMHTKFTGSKCNFEIVDCSVFKEFKQMEEKGGHKKIAETEVKTHKQYLQRCAYKFFYSSWDAFNGVYGFYFKSALEHSLVAHAKAFKKKYSIDSEKSWPPDNSLLTQNLEKIPYSNKNNPDAWHDKVRHLLTPAIIAREMGVNALAGMCHLQYQNSVEPVVRIPNILIAYRSFGRDIGNIRYQNKEKGYVYDTRFLVPDISEQISKKHHYFRSFLSRLQEKKRKNYEVVNKNGKYRTRLLYGNFFKGRNINKLLPSAIRALKKEEKELLINQCRKITEHLDVLFWTMLEDGKIDEIIDNLSSPVGKNARSFVDPVYHSGLIHINKLFEMGGLDRFIDANFHKENMDIQAFVEENKNDLLRIVTLYYLICEMANPKKNADFDPRRIACILVPIKMRGSVWGVAIHATYVYHLPDGSEFDKEYNGLYSILDTPIWISNYQLMTAVADYIQNKFDKILWENALQRVSRLLEQTVSKLTPADDIIEKLQNDFNPKIMGESRLVPYGLPQFQLDAKTARDAIVLKGKTGADYKYHWGVEENHFFLAAQPWDRQGTRTYQQALEIGFRRGIEQLGNK